MSPIIKVTLSYGDLIVLGGSGYPACAKGKNESITPFYSKEHECF